MGTLRKTIDLNKVGLVADQLKLVPDAFEATVVFPRRKVLADQCVFCPSGVSEDSRGFTCGRKGAVTNESTGVDECALWEKVELPLR